MPVFKYRDPQTGEWINAAGGSKIECVKSFNGRTGAVVPASGDYTAEMVGAAPAGHGLGINAPVIKTTSPLGSGRTGWFRTNDDLTSLGLTSGWWFGQYIAYGDNDGVWELNHYLDGLKAVIRIVNGVMQPAEWENPPMVLGTEYRTTERYLGKPVYVKLCNFGAMPNNATETKADIIPRHINCVSIQGYTVANSGKSGPFEIAAYRKNIDMQTNTSGNVTITTTADLSSYTAYILIKYTQE